MKIQPYHSSIARIENIFIFNAQYNLTAREQKIVLFLVGRINPTGKKFDTQIIPIKELKTIIMNKRSGSFYDRVLDFSERIMTKTIRFDTSVKMGKRTLPGFVSWFQSITPIYNEAGEICLEFMFAEKMKPFLLQLKEYAQIDYLQTVNLKSGFSIRMYLIFRAHRDKMLKHQKHSTLTYELAELKHILGVGDKYKDWRKFNRDVVSVIDREINAHTNIKCKIKQQRKGRKIVGLEFEISDKPSKGSSAILDVSTKPSASAAPVLEALTFAQKKAFDLLVAYQITKEIALEMISRVGGSELVGFEDWYFEIVLSIFDAKTNQEEQAAKAGTLVNWFLKKKVFEQGDHFAKIMERLQARKKQQQKERPDAWGNRLLAKTMTSREFIKRFNG